MDDGSCFHFYTNENRYIMLNKTPFVQLHGLSLQSAPAKTLIELADFLGEAVSQTTEPATKPQVIFKVTEANLETGVPQVSDFKLGKLSKVTSDSNDRCLLSVKLREDFRFNRAEEAAYKELLALSDKGYKGNGLYQLALDGFVECSIEIQ